MNTCHTCHWTDCPDVGKEQQACENWTSDPDGEVPNLPDPFAAMEARIADVRQELDEMKEQVERVEMMVSRMVTSMITALADVD